ncbi:MAG: ribonuclease HII [Clostridia bacterium]|nr:ribonuclease HII [Clostridia bacterium]
MLPEKSSVTEIQQYFLSLSEEEQQEYLKLLAGDPRKSIRKLAEKYQSLLAKKLVEKQRVLEMWSYEKSLFSQNYKYIVGIDEAGRGPLAGPVVAAAVILPPFCIIEGLNDSKKLCPQKRSLLANEIKTKAIKWAVGVVDSITIDRINILQATRYAMQLALKALGSLPDFVLIDGQKNPLISMPQMAIIKGDALSASIAAASIIAKVHRDTIMDSYDKIYPDFNFAVHKGYCTQQHLEAIRHKGCSDIHRKSFSPVKESL